MTTIITSPNWQGERAEPINPAEIRFKAKPSRDCNGCLFATQTISVCHAAAGVAKADGIPDCDNAEKYGTTYVYVIDKSDPRQMDMLKEVTA